MKKIAPVITGIILIVLGIAFFTERGFFANLLLDANVIGNMGLWPVDTSKVNGVVITGAIAFIGGVVLTITGIYKTLDTGSSNQDY
ncbi:MAG: hypothetical protein GXO91_01000 [FCB group bacterium]|nr:hypothetical protein [FCB group bacterium]